jgi:hypothetical protein
MKLALVPVEGLGVVVPAGEPARDRTLQARNALEAAAADGVAGDEPLKGFSA